MAIFEVAAAVLKVVPAAAALAGDGNAAMRDRRLNMVL